MALVSFEQVSLEFGDVPIFREIDFNIESNERICLIGRNGAGKSTLLNLITGQLQPDHGEIKYRQDIRISQLEQKLPGSIECTVVETIREGLADLQALITEYRKLSQQHLNPQGLRELEALQHRIDTSGGWKIEQQVETIVSQLDLPADKKMSELSGGWRRRVALGKALVSNPDILLLDEPTNHLDIATIEWLEHKIRGYQGCVIFITHDRTLLQKLATRIVEIDRGKLVSWQCDYRKYLILKEQAIEEEDNRNALFDKRLSEEENWIRQGIKARRTRNEGRVRALMVMRAERAKRIKRQGKARIHVETAEQSGRKVIEAKNITHGYGEQVLIKDFSLKIMRGDRIGLIGNNGVGKSTLLKILLGKIDPQHGTVKLGTNIKLGYFDQVHRVLDPEKTIAETIGNGREYVKVNGKDRHVVGYLTNFMFSPKRAMTPVKVLSGGECNRVLLASLFTQAVNVLILDEPTNDLDVEMLEVLEEQLVQYPGTLILVSHDRNFLDNVVTSTLVFEGDGRVQEYPGGYSDWLRQGKSLIEVDRPDVKIKTVQNKNTDLKTDVVKKKLSYKLQRELDLLPGEIEKTEQRIDKLQQQISKPDFYTQHYAETQSVLDELSTVQHQLEQLINRWTELESLVQ
ncbi:MAG: ATP-binding cassette domain-containing protein [Gammaproteobacteria bacterium]|nr:ATP-binding cassette domain-containing protein [Gammaproteobacteria bacterium]